MERMPGTRRRWSWLTSGLLSSASRKRYLDLVMGEEQAKVENIDRLVDGGEEVDRVDQFPQDTLLLAEGGGDVVSSKTTRCHSQTRQEHTWHLQVNQVHAT